jgi:elongation factor P
MSKINTAQFHKGMFIEFKGEPYQIMEFQHVNPGKGSAFVRTKLKGFKTGKSLEFTFKSGDSMEEIPINTQEMQYLYQEGEKYVFMDNFSYEQFSLAKELLGDYVLFLKENDTYQILVHESEAVGIRFPKKVRLKVTETDDAVKGNTVSGATKQAKLETGATIQVPLFIKEGDTVGVDPELGEYVDRANG